VLDNGWTVTWTEMNKLFDLCQLRDKVKVEERSSPFLEFILFIAMAF